MSLSIVALPPLHKPPARMWRGALHALRRMRAGLRAGRETRLTLGRQVVAPHIFARYGSLR